LLFVTFVPEQLRQNNQLLSTALLLGYHSDNRVFCYLHAFYETTALTSFKDNTLLMNLYCIASGAPCTSHLVTLGEPYHIITRRSGSIDLCYFRKLPRITSLLREYITLHYAVGSGSLLNLLCYPGNEFSNIAIATGPVVLMSVEGLGVIHL